MDYPVKDYPVLPKRLYHGTTGAVARAVFAGKEALSPRGDGHADKWNGLASNPEMVYLTDVYAPGYAMHACNYAAGANLPSKELGIIEIDTSGLRPELFYPDEDFLGLPLEGWAEHEPEAVPGYDSPLDPNLSLRERVALNRDTLLEKRAFAGVCLEQAGLVAYRGVIPARAVTRVALLNWERHVEVAGLVMDTGSGANHYRFCKKQAEAVTRWFFKDKAEITDVLGDTIPIERLLREQSSSYTEFAIRRYREWQLILERPGREVLSRVKKPNGGMERAYRAYVCGYEVKLIAETHGVTKRTIWNWIARCRKWHDENRPAAPVQETEDEDTP